MGRTTTWRVRAPALVALVAALAYVGMPAASAAPGDIDTSFSDDGTLLLGFPPGSSGLTDLAVRSDGRIVVVGEGRHNARSVFEIGRLLPNGRLDPTFGNHGRTIVPFPGKEATTAFPLPTPKVALAPDGGIVLAGSVVGPGASAKDDIALLRLSPGGRPDTAFGDGGRVVTNLGGADDATDVAIDGSGRIVVSGETEQNGSSSAVALRYLPSGELDHSFGANGVATIPTRTGTGTLGRGAGALAVALGPGGKIVLCGGSGRKFLVARLQSDGSPDRTFAGSGRTLFGFLHESVGLDVALTPSGRIVVAGVTSPSGSIDEHMSIAVARLNSLGQLDPSFGTGGKVETNTGGGDLAFGVSVQADGRIVVAGSSDLQTLFGKHLEVLRYTTAGKLDPSFNTVGVVNIDLGPASEFWSDLILRNGRATVAGFVQTTSTTPGHTTGAVARFQL